MTANPSTITPLNVATRIRTDGCFNRARNAIAPESLLYRCGKIAGDVLKISLR
jgi:hypothetical protein